MFGMVKAKSSFLGGVVVKFMNILLIKQRNNALWAL